MIFMLGKDSSFFTVTSPDYPNGDNMVDQADVISLDVTEEMGKMTTGTLNLLDRRGVYTRIFRTGVQLDLTWGYMSRGPFEVPDSLTGQTADTFKKNLVRRGLRVLVQSPGGTGGDDGRYIYHCNFISAGWVGGLPVIKIWESGNKGSVVRQLLKEIGVDDASMDVRFNDMDASYSTAYAERQEETSFATLNRLALEFQCLFRVATKADGSFTAFFLSPDNLANSPVVAAMGGDISNYKTFIWRDSDEANVKSWSWQNEEGENGAGDSVKVSFVGGKMITQRFTVENDHVVTWELDTDAVKASLAGKDFQAQAELTKKVMDVTDFNDPVIKRLFKRIDQTTAPNGYGYTISLELFGDPTMTAGMVALFGKGFPDVFSSKDYKLSGGLAYLQRSGGSKRNLIYYIRKVTHKLGAKYDVSAECVDVMTVSAMGIK